MANVSDMRARAGRVPGRQWVRRRGWPVNLVALGLAVLAVTPSNAGTELERFDRARITFTYPSEWFVTTQPLSRRAVSPVYRFAVSTVKVRHTPEDIGPCLPGIAKQLPRDAVLAFLREATGADRARSLPAPIAYLSGNRRDSCWA